MDLMTQSTSFMLLKAKYREFAAPTVRIKVDGAEIVEKMAGGITNLSVDLTSEYPASGCCFDVMGEYLPEQTGFNPMGCAKKLQLGARVEVSLGYITVEKVFVGLITQVEYQFDAESTPAIHIECMDAKCLLMKTQRLELVGEKKVQAVIKQLLSDAPVSSYLDGKKVESTSEKKLPLGRNMESDYDFIVRQAQYSGSEFFVLCGKAYFRRPPPAAMPILELSPGNGLLSASLSLQGEELVKTVRVVGVDPETDKMISGNVKISGKFSKGATANKMLSGTERAYLDPLATTAEAAQSRAKVLMNGITARFGILRAECIGLPELVPGRQIKVKGLCDEAKHSYYITNVRHTLGDDGFSTSLEARIDSL